MFGIPTVSVVRDATLYCGTMTYWLGHGGPLLLPMSIAIPRAVHRYLGMHAQGTSSGHGAVGATIQMDPAELWTICDIAPQHQCPRCVDPLCAAGVQPTVVHTHRGHAPLVTIIGITAWCCGLSYETVTHHCWIP